MSYDWTVILNIPDIKHLEKINHYMKERYNNEFIEIPNSRLYIATCVSYFVIDDFKCFLNSIDWGTINDGTEHIRLERDVKQWVNFVALPEEGYRFYEEHFSHTMHIKEQLEKYD